MTSSQFAELRLMISYLYLNSMYLHTMYLLCNLLTVYPFFTPQMPKIIELLKMPYTYFAQVYTHFAQSIYLFKFVL